MENWAINTAATTTGTYYMPIVTTTGSSAVVTNWGGGGAGWAPSPPAPQSPLQWLDSEVEKTCALARPKPGG